MVVLLLFRYVAGTFFWNVHVQHRPHQVVPGRFVSERRVAPEEDNKHCLWDDEVMKGMVQTFGAVRVLYESERIIAIRKPHGISHHGSLQSIPGIMSYFRHLQALGDKGLLCTSYRGRIYGVHRLDKATSGILIFAKDPITARELIQCFRNKSIVKYYVALSSKKPRKKKQGWVKGDMTRGRRGTWMLKKAMSDPAVTRFYTAGLGGLKRKESVDSGNGHVGVIPRTLLLFRPYTGRTHQLRVAAKSLGLPIIGDSYYGGGTNDIAQTKESKLRTFLHSAALHIQLRDETITIWDPPPFEHLWENNCDFSDCVIAIMRKHCACEQILDLLPQ